MTSEELDQLALYVVRCMDDGEYKEDFIGEFARRYRAALAEKMEPVGYFEPTGDGDYEQVLSVYKDGSNVVPLYFWPMEGWKK